MCIYVNGNGILPKATSLTEGALAFSPRRLKLANGSQGRQADYVRPMGTVGMLLSNINHGHEK